ncbi:MAG: hypothetical protein QNJ54_33110 [Prochloraceae cyanobacterium]|nr:hypothetical protein [Prochloraceae cyanobacterium]
MRIRPDRGCSASRRYADLEEIAVVPSRSQLSRLDRSCLASIAVVRLDRSCPVSIAVLLSRSQFSCLDRSSPVSIAVIPSRSQLFRLDRSYSVSIAVVRLDRSCLASIAVVRLDRSCPSRSQLSPLAPLRGSRRDRFSTTPLSFRAARARPQNTRNLHLENLTYSTFLTSRV